MKFEKKIMKTRYLRNAVLLLPIQERLTKCLARKFFILDFLNLAISMNQVFFRFGDGNEGRLFCFFLYFLLKFSPVQGSRAAQGKA